MKQDDESPPGGNPSSCWERQEMVDRFAARPPDERLVELLASEKEELRVLDLGCAGGRNTVLLAEHGCDVHAIDASAAMVARTRERLAPLVGRREAERRVRQGRMTELDGFPNDTFDLVVALGIYHNASSLAEWHRALAATSRILREGGRLLVAVFTPATDLTGDGIRRVPGEPHTFDGFPSGRATLMDAATLDREVASYGLAPATPSRTVETRTENGRRVTVNALYRKLPANQPAAH